MVYDAIYGLTYGANYNYSINLPPGTYNWTSYANDTSGNWNSTPTWMMEGTKGKGTPALTLSIDGAEADRSVTYGTTTTVAAAESNSGDLDVNYTFYRGTSNITSPDTSILSEGTYVYVYNSTGGTNWSSSSVTRTLNVTAAIFTPSSPGSSGPASTPSTKVSVKKGEANITIPSIAGGKSTNVTIAKTEDVAIRQINISVSNPVNNIKIVITKLAGVPSSVTHMIEGKVYHYIQIDKTNITDSDLNKAYIKFAINKTWLTINGVDKTNMALYRWANDKWNELATTYVSEDSLEVFYQAETPGFSYFLIGTKGGEVTTQAPTGEAITCTESWSCTDWSACNNSQQTRACTDTNNCGTIAIKPEESQTCQIALTEITTQQFPMFEVSLIIIVSIIIIILFILKLIGKLNINSIRKIKPRRMKKENIPKPPENVKYYYSKKDFEEEAEKDKDKKENK
jgi:PGF-pre-PGF domain-containing protein